MKKYLKMIPARGIPVLLFVLMAAVLVYVINLRINASSFGSSIGTGMGSIVGKAIGSFEGMKDGAEDGKEAGLSAEDTVAEIANQFEQVNNLEVLVASVKLGDIHNYGEEKSLTYAALYIVNGNVVFTVDLSLAEITEKEDGLHIVLPKPVGTLYLDNRTVEKVAEYQRRFFNGSAEDGFDAYINTMAKVQEATEETLSNYGSLIASARTAAENQVTLLTNSVSTAERNIIIEWADLKEAQ